MALDLDLDYISELCSNEAGPPQTTPNYWSVHTHPKPRPLGQKSLYLSSNVWFRLVPLSLPSRQELPGKRDKAAGIMKGCLPSGRREGHSRMWSGADAILPQGMQITEEMTHVIYELSPLKI